MPRVLPTRPNLEHLKNQARDLLNAYRAGDAAARRLFGRHLAHTPRAAALAHALLVIAREYGFASWPQLKQRVQALAAQVAAPAESPAADERRARKVARQQRIEQLAEQWVAAARGHNLEQLFAAMRIGAREGDAVRAYLVERGLFAIVVDALLAGVDHPNARMRFLSAQAMDHFADQRCAEPLRLLLRDPVPRVRWAAIHSLQCEACKLVPLASEADVVATLIDLALHDPSVKVRRVATYELGNICADARAVAALEAIRAQSDDRTILRSARRALDLHRRASSCADDAVH